MKVAVVGATGLVGGVMLEVLETSHLPPFMQLHLKNR